MRSSHRHTAGCDCHVGEAEVFLHTRGEAGNGGGEFSHIGMQIRFEQNVVHSAELVAGRQPEGVSRGRGSRCREPGGPEAAAARVE